MGVEALIPIAVSLAGNFLTNLITPMKKVGKLDPLALRAVAEYGAPISQPYGRVKIEGCSMFWSLPLIEVITNTQSSGKGFGARTRTYTYYMTSAFLIGGEITGIKRVWMNGVQVFDEDSKRSSTGLSFYERLLHYEAGQGNYIDAYNINSNFYSDKKSERFSYFTERFLGGSTQAISSVIRSVEGGNIPAMRGRSYFVTNRYPIVEFDGSGFPKVDVEVFGKLGPFPLVNDIITDIFTEAGFNTANLDLSDIPSNQSVQGIFFQKTGETFADYIQEIQRLFFLIVREDGDKIVFLRKNRPSITLTIGINNLRASADGNKIVDPYKAKTIHARELPSEVQLTTKNVGDAYNQLVVYARNPIAKNSNPLSIQTRITSDQGEIRGIANRMIAEIAVQRNYYTDMSLLPCWYSKLKLGDVITLQKGNSQIAIQLTKKLLTKDYLVQIEGNRYVDGDYGKVSQFKVLVRYTALYAFIVTGPTGGYIIIQSGGIYYSITSVPIVGSVGSLQVAVANTGFGRIVGVLRNNSDFYPLLTPGQAGSQYPGSGYTPTYGPGGFVTDPSSYIADPTQNYYGGGSDPEFLGNPTIYAVVPYYGNYDTTKYDVYNDSRFYNIEQVRVNYLPQSASNYSSPYQPSQGTLIVLDIPLLSNTDKLFSAYFVVKNIYNFTSGTIYYSTDSGASYQKSITIGGHGTVGTVANALTTGIAQIIDKSSSFIVTSNDIVNTVTTDVFLSGSNLILVGSEIIAFRDVTLLGSNQYQLSYLIRGCKGTEWAMSGHVNNEQAVLLSNLAQLTGDSTYINQSFLFKIVPFDADETDITNTVSLTYSGNAVKPYSVTDISAVKDSITGDILFSWHRRTYQYGGLADYIDIQLSPGELLEYRLVIAGLRTTIATDTQYTYTASQQSLDGFTGSSISLSVTPLSSYVGTGTINSATLLLT